MSYIVLLWLIWISIYDIKSRRIPWMLMGLGVVLSITACEVGVAERRLVIGDIIADLLPGILLLALAVCTKLVGYADGVVLICLGVPGGFHKTMGTWLLSLFFIGIYSVVLLVLRKANRRTKIPYLPFLTIAWLGITLIESLEGCK